MQVGARSPVGDRAIFCVPGMSYAQDEVRCPRDSGFAGLRGFTFQAVDSLLEDRWEPRHWTRLPTKIGVGIRRVALGTQRRHDPKPRLVQCAGDQVTSLQACREPDLWRGSQFIPKTLRVLETLRVWPFASWSTLYTRPRKFDTAQMFGYNTYLFRTVVLRLTTSPPCAEWANATQRQESTRNYRIPLLLFHTNTLAATGRYLPLLGTHIPKRRARPPGQGLGRALCITPKCQIPDTMHAGWKKRYGQGIGARLRILPRSLCDQNQPPQVGHILASSHKEPESTWNICCMVYQGMTNKGDRDIME
jgi:hypothetical protein